MADNYNNNDDELLEKLRKVLNFSSDSNSDNDNEEPESFEEKKPEPKKVVNAAFDMSVFDDAEETTPYQQDDDLISFSDTLDRFFETSTRPVAKNTSLDSTASFVPPKKNTDKSDKTADSTAPKKTVKEPEEESASDNTYGTKTDISETQERTVKIHITDADSTSSDTKEIRIPYDDVKSESSGDTIAMPDTDNKNSDRQSSMPETGGRTSFNRTFATGEDEIINDDTYSADENDIMDSMQKVKLNTESDTNSIDDLYNDEDTIKLSREEKKRRKKELKERKAASASSTFHGEFIEFSKYAQKDLLDEKYNSKNRSFRLRIILSILFGLPLLALEILPLFGIKLFHFISIDYNPQVYILVLLQLFLLISACAFTFLVDGARSLFRRSVTPETLGTFYCIATVAYGVIMAFTATPDNVCPAFFSPTALCIINLLFYRYRALGREMYGFDIVSNDCKKLTLEPQSLSPEIREKNDLFEFLPEDASAFRIKYTPFVHSFVKKSRQSCKDKSALNYILPIIAVCFAAALTATIILKNELPQAMTATMSAFAFIVPTAIFTGFSLPFYRSADRAHKLGSAILGEHAADKFSSAAIISLKDSEVFPDYSIKNYDPILYNNSRIDYVLFATASVFNKIGGPLKSVFKEATETYGITDDVNIVRIEYDGIEATVNSDSILIGSAAFMERNDLSPAYSVNDESTETANEKRVMYIASNGKINAKMHIRYRMNPDIASTINQLAKMGICISVMTLDPNIDSELLSTHIDINKYPVRVIKCASPDDLAETSTDSTYIVSNRSPKALLQTLTVCKKLRSTVRTNLLLSLLSVIIGIMTGVLIILTGNEANINSLYIVIYQIFWILLSHIITAISV